MIQAASDTGDDAAGLMYFVFDLLYLDGEDVAALPLIKARETNVPPRAPAPVYANSIQTGA